jgi:hypothetical protein
MHLGERFKWRMHGEGLHNFWFRSEYFWCGWIKDDKIAKTYCADGETVSTLDIAIQLVIAPCSISKDGGSTLDFAVY